MTPQEALATIIRTLVTTAPPIKKPRPRKPPRPPLRQEPLPLDLGPPLPPEATVTQAELEALERQLRGESPNGYYKPAEGVAPWMEH